MKRTILAIVCILAGVTAFAQGKVTTRKYRLADFPDKITKIVLTGNSLTDGALRQEVVKCWSASAFEFCTMQEFESLKVSEDYYFILPAEMRLPGEETPGIMYLTLVKGSPQASEGIGGMHEVCSIPLCPAEGSSGRELVYLGAILESLQEFALEAMTSEMTAYRMSDWFNAKYSRQGKMKSIWISEDDLAAGIPAQLLQSLDVDIHIVTEDEADGQYLQGGFNVLTGYVVAPSQPGKGSVCYAMLFSADTHRLFFISKHKISDKEGPGFTTADIKRIRKER